MTKNLHFGYLLVKPSIMDVLDSHECREKITEAYKEDERMKTDIEAARFDGL